MRSDSTRVPVQGTAIRTDMIRSGTIRSDVTRGCGCREGPPHPARGAVRDSPRVQAVGRQGGGAEAGAEALHGGPVGLAGSVDHEVSDARGLGMGRQSDRIHPDI